MTQGAAALQLIIALNFAGLATPLAFTGVNELRVHVPGSSVLSPDMTVLRFAIFVDRAPLLREGVVAQASLFTGPEDGCTLARVLLNGIHQQHCPESPCVVALPPLEYNAVHTLTVAAVDCKGPFHEHVTKFSLIPVQDTRSEVLMQSSQCQKHDASCAGGTSWSDNEVHGSELELQWEAAVAATCGAATEQRCLSAGESADGACSGHGRCSRLGYCFCYGDWAGERCEHSVLVNSTYLPTRLPWTSGHGCAQAMQWNLQSGGLTAAIDALQRRRCSSDVETVVLDTLGLALGGQINLASLALAYAFNLNRSLVLHGRWRYGDHAGCLVPGRACYFRNGLSCPDHQLERKGVLLRPRNQGGHVIEHTDTFAVREGLRPHAAVEAHGLFWWTSHFVSYVTRPSRDLDAKLRLAALHANVQWPAVGLHVRHGDACVHAAQSNSRPLCRPFEEYVPPLLAMQRQYGVSSVFLSTDDAAVAAEARARLAPLGFAVATQPLDRSVFESSWFIEHRVEAQALDARLIADSMLVDLLLLRQCDFLVGTLASQMSRLALSLIAHRLGVVPPYVSVDGMGAGCCAWAGENLEGYDNEAYRRITRLY